MPAYSALLGSWLEVSEQSHGLLFTISEEEPGVLVELGARVPGERVGKGELEVEASRPQIAPARLQRRDCQCESVRSGP